MNKKMVIVVFGIVFSLFTFSCATKLPPIDPSLPNSEMAVLLIPKNIFVINMNDVNVAWESGQLREVRIPAGRHTFYVNSEENVLVPDTMGVNALIGSTANYKINKQWLEGNITHTFEAGKSYMITSQMRHRGTFGSQFVEYTIAPYTDSYPDDLYALGIDFGFGETWNEEFYMGVSLGLKFPKLPIFWSINLDSNNLGISGDYLFYKRLFPSAGFFGYFGVGLGLGAKLSSDESGSLSDEGNYFVALGRAPIGLSWLAVGSDMGFEMYVQALPTLGTLIPNFNFPYGSWSIDIGMRMWY